MKITSAEFVKGVVGTDDILESNFPQVAFIGRSNSGKSSVLNTLANKKGLAITSSWSGRTQEINVFLINKSLYFVDLPGYGFAKLSKGKQEWLQKLIYWYFFKAPYQQKAVILIIDANIGLTELDKGMFFALLEQGKNIVMVANKIDKIKKILLQQRIQDIQDFVGDCVVIPYSATKKIGVNLLLDEIFK